MRPAGRSFPSPDLYDAKTIELRTVGPKLTQIGYEDRVNKCIPALQELERAPKNNLSFYLVN